MDLPDSGLALLDAGANSDAGFAPDAAPEDSGVSTATSGLALNHFYAVVDRETAQAIATSAYLSDTFAAFAERTNSSGIRTWTGLYVFGHDTYIELFAPGAIGPAGNTGVAFAVETVGGIDAIAAEESALGHHFTVSDQRFVPPEGGSIPWFHMGTHAPDPFHPPALFEWAMEYRPEYIAYVLNDQAHDPADIPRSAMLQRFYAPEKLMENIRALRFAMPVEARDGFGAAARSYGWRVRLEGETLTAEGPEITIVVVADAVHRGLLEVQLALNRGIDTPLEVPIGTSTLTVGPGRVARWRFTPVNLP